MILKIFHFLSLLILMPVSLSAQIRIQTQVNANKIGTEDILEIRYSFTAPPGGIEERHPGFKGFRVVMNNKVIINNQYEYTYQLKAVNTGRYTLSGLTIIDSEGNTSTADPVQVQVVKGTILKNDEPGSSSTPNPSSVIDRLERIRQQLYQDPFTLQGLGDVDEHFFIVPETSKNSYYLGEPIPVTYKLYNNTGFSGANITSLPNNSDFISKNFDFEERPEERIETYNNIRYRTFSIKRVILYGYKTGTFDIGGMTISAFVDYFGKAEARTKKKSITILPLPPVPEGKTFQGGVGHFSLAAQYSQVNSTTDDPITLTLNITGSGNMESTYLPEIKWPGGITVSEPETSISTSDNNPEISSKTYTFYIYAEEDTSVTIPPIEWTYFDPSDQTYKTLSTGEQQLTFFPGTPVEEDTSGTSLPTNDSEGNSENKAAKWLLIISVLGIAAAAGGYFFYKKQKEKYRIDPTAAPLQSDSPDTDSRQPPQVPEHTEAGETLLSGSSQDYGEVSEPEPYNFHGFDLDHLLYESRYLKEIDFFRSAHQYIIDFLQKKGIRSSANEAIIAELRAGKADAEVVSVLQDVFRYISMQYYNPLPLGDSEREALIGKITALSRAFDHHT